MKKSKLIHVSFDEVGAVYSTDSGTDLSWRRQYHPQNMRSAERNQGAARLFHRQARLFIICSWYVFQPLSMPIIWRASRFYSDQIADKVPGCACHRRNVDNREIPVVVRQFDYEIVNPFIIKKKDGNGTVERFLVGYDSLKRVDYQDNWRNLARKMGMGKRAEDYFMSHKPDLTYRCFMSNLDDGLLKLLGVI